MGRFMNPESDGKFYEKNDMVRLGCGDCKDCHACCTDMGESILLDPYDMYELTKATGLDFTQLMERNIIALTVVSGMILPHIKMQESANQCFFLNEKGRCQIHEHRPGICRLFPLGRDYQGEKISYIFLKKFCPQTGHEKIKVSKWIGVDDFASYEDFLYSWFQFRKEMGKMLLEAEASEAQTMGSYLLKLFYITPYSQDDFGTEVKERMDKIRNLFN